ncbi:MAG: alanine--glyoxylate aminotransferase family protein [Desulfovibrio sp.]|nr:alanine--glyoxylate aminotransferase family protein [Desulfovibrio sp.]
MLNKKRLLTPGPTPLPEEARLALARDMIHHRKQEFQNIMLAVQEKARVLFGTREPVLPLACSGTGAMTAAVYSLFKPGDPVLVVNSGKFGERWVEIAKSRGLDTDNLELPWGEYVSPEVAAERLNKKSYKGILVQVCETSTGAILPVKEIGEIKGSALLVADGISAVGVSPCPMDKWRIDCLLTGSQKGLMLPPGLALLALSQKAWKTAGDIEPGCFYFNLPKERKALEKGQTSFTTPVNLIVGLKASLDLIGDPSRIYRKQWALTALVRRGAAAAGLELFIHKNYAWGVTSIKMPKGVDGQKILKIAETRFGVYMAGGQDRLKGKIVRLGHMGWVDWSDCLAGLFALTEALREESGFIAEPGWSVAALEAYEKALREGCP